MSIFAPLHIKSGYSLLQSGLTIEKIKTSLIKNDYFGAGLSDTNCLFGVHEFNDMMKSISKPSIIGMDIKINNDNLSLYVLNEEGYRNLFKINFLIQKECLTLKDIKENCNGLLCVIETKGEEFKNQFKELGISNEFAKYLINISESFKDNFYLGIEITSREEIEYANQIREFAKKYTYKTVAFPKVLYVKKEDAIVIDIVSAIANDDVLEYKSRVGQEYFMLEKDYMKIYTQEEIKSTIDIINASTFDINVKRGTLLKYTIDNSTNLLKENCYKALDKYNVNDEEHISRLDYELSVIDKMGYSDYFLLVQDYVKYAKENGILVGPGRGSAAGSLVSYLLNITEVDPLKYNLQFERFLNPARSTMPDIDVDFMDIRRDDMVEYMRSKYGQNRVANIVTFQHIMAKQSLRDIQRVFNYPTNHIDLLCKTLPNDNHSKDITLREAYKREEKFRKLVDSDKYFLEIVSLASKIEGLPRQSGMHAAGIVVNEEPLETVMPVSLDFQGNYITQYEMGYLEKEGFLKMDFLSLRNLTVIDLAVKLINSHYPDVHLEAKDIPYDSPEIFEIIRNRYVMGIFQLETQAMKRGIKIIKPNCFDDVVALLAINRPGPMQYMQEFADRKEGKKPVTYLSKSLEEILSSTYGIIIYQEQINKIAQAMAGFSPSEADIFRRAISKKDKDKILKAKDGFIKGSIAQGYSEKEATDVFNMILKFANYGFNKSHSVVYSIIACQLAWLKANYPLEFYASILQIGSSVTDSKFNEYVSEMKQKNLKIYSPNINESTLLFTIKEDGLLFPLSAIHGVNITMNSNVIKERENGKFIDLFDFVLRMYNYGISESQCKAYINSGALDVLSPSRSSMRVSLKGALQFAELNHSEDGQLSMGIMESLKPAMTHMEDDPIDNLNQEYDTIGIMLSDNPLKYKKALLEDKSVTPIVELDSKGSFTIAGIIKAKKNISTKKSETMCFVKIFDETGEIEITVFPRVYDTCYQFLEKNKTVLIKGKVEIDAEEEKSMIVDEITLLESEEI